MNVRAAIDLIGRVMLAAIFVIDGVRLLQFGEGARGYMESFGVPGALYPLVVFAHIGGGVAIAAGFLTRLAASGLCVFALAAAAIFHTDFANASEFNHFWKNIGLAGAFLIVALHGPGAWSIDRKFPILGSKLQG